MDLFWLWLLPYAVKLLISAYTMLSSMSISGIFGSVSASGAFVISPYLISFLCVMLFTLAHSDDIRQTCLYMYSRICRYVQYLIDLYRPYNRAEYKALLESEFQRMSMMLGDLSRLIDQPSKRNPLDNTTTAVFFSNAVQRALEGYDNPKVMQIIPTPYATPYRLSRTTGSMAFHITDVLNIRFKVLNKPYRIVYDGVYQTGYFRLIHAECLLADEAYSYYKLDELTKPVKPTSTSPGIYFPRIKPGPFYILFEHNGAGVINKLRSIVLSTPNTVGLAFDLNNRLGCSFGRPNTVCDLMLVDDYYGSYIYNDDDYGFDRRKIKQYGNTIVMDIF